MTAVSWLLVLPAIVLATVRGAAPERVKIDMATLHAAALTTSRTADDTTDSPFLVVGIIGRGSSSTKLVPEGDQSLRRDGAIGARPLTELSLAEGDSVQVLVSVLEQSGSRISGALWIGSASLLITNEAGSVFWRRLDCVASCKVLTPPAATVLPTAPNQPVAGVLELTGSGGTYHLALRATREFSQR